MQIIPQAFFCAIGKHNPDRHRVEWDGQHYVGNCKGCCQTIYRKAHRRWRVIGEADRQA